MRVCDRHPDRRASDRVHIEADDSYFDLCAECKTDLLTFLCRPRESGTDEAPKRRGRPPKNLTQVE